MSTDPELISRIIQLEHKVSLILRQLGVDEEAVSEAPPDDEIARLLTKGNLIEAIKVYRQRTGVGLAEAKLAVEQMKAQLGR
jgi:ribosomal protein L7/L12